MTTQGLATLVGPILRRSLSALVAAMSVAPAVAEERHAVVPAEPATFYPASTGSREVCTTISWGSGERTECRIDTLGVNPALHGICTTYYGRRVCY